MFSAMAWKLSCLSQWIASYQELLLTIITLFKDNTFTIPTYEELRLTPGDEQSPESSLSLITSHPVVAGYRLNLIKDDKDSDGQALVTCLYEMIDALEVIVWDTAMETTTSSA